MKIKKIFILIDLILIAQSICTMTHNEKLLEGAWKNNVELVNKALKEGADINFQDKDEETALMLAALKSNLDVVRLLLTHKADVNIKSNLGETALIYATAKSDPKNTIINYNIAKLLLDAGADPNIQTRRKNTALMFAARDSKIEIIKLLLDCKNINLDLQNDNGETALMLGILHLLDYNIIQLLLDSGASLNLKNKNQDTAIDIANHIFRNGILVKQIENEYKKRKKFVQEAISPYLIPNLASIVIDYVV